MNPAASYGHLTGTGDADGFRGAVTAWFRWQLMGDPIARRHFVGPDPAIATSQRCSAYVTNARLQALGAEAKPRPAAPA